MLAAQEPEKKDEGKGLDFSEVGYDAQRGATMLIATGASGPACLNKAAILVDGMERYRWREEIWPKPRNVLFFKAVRYFWNKTWQVALTKRKPLAGPRPEIKSFTTVQPLDSSFLATIHNRNGKPLPRTVGLDHEKAVESLLYFQALSYAHRTPFEVFERSAKAGEVLTEFQLYPNPEVHQGKILHFTGKLERAVKITAPPRLREQGIEHYYEIWISNVDVFENKKLTVMALCPSLPDGINPQPKYQEPYQVSIAGYFFKMYGFQTEKDQGTNSGKQSPMLIGQVTFTGAQPAEEDGGSVIGTLGALALLVAVGMIIIGGLMWWSRRDDAEVQARIAAVQRRRNLPVEEKSAATEAQSPEEERAPSLLGDDWPPSHGV